VLNKCFQSTTKNKGIKTNVLNFRYLSLKSMKTLQDLSKTNAIYNLSKVIGELRPDGSGTHATVDNALWNGAIHH